MKILLRAMLAFKFEPSLNVVAFPFHVRVEYNPLGGDDTIEVPYHQERMRRVPLESPVLLQAFEERFPVRRAFVKVVWIEFGEFLSRQERSVFRNVMGDIGIESLERGVENDNTYLCKYLDTLKSGSKCHEPLVQLSSVRSNQIVAEFRTNPTGFCGILAVTLSSHGSQTGASTGLNPPAILWTVDVLGFSRNRSSKRRSPSDEFGHDISIVGFLNHLVQLENMLFSHAFRSLDIVHDSQ
jgi:hypothetical protein